MTALALWRDVRGASPRVVALLWLPGLVAALLVASPVANVFTASGIDQLPTGDSVLFAHGGHHLLEVLVQRSQQLEAVAYGALATASLTALVLIVPLGAAFSSLGTNPAETLGSAISRGVQMAPRFALLGGATLLAQAMWLLVALATWASLLDVMADALDAPTLNVLAALVIALACIPAWGLGLLRDVARARHRLQRRSVRDDVTGAIRIARRAGATLVGAAAAVAVGSGALVALAAAMVHWIDVGQPEPWRVAAVTIAHQTTAMGVATLRAAWLATCVHHAATDVEPT